MSADILVLVEHRIEGMWVLVDVDPHVSAERNSERLLALKSLCKERPDNLSAGTKYWLADGAKFLAVLSLSEAVSAWHRTEVDQSLGSGNAKQFQSLALSYFGCWNIDPDEWRIVVASHGEPGVASHVIRQAA